MPGTGESEGKHYDHEGEAEDPRRDRAGEQAQAEGMEGGQSSVKNFYFFRGETIENFGPGWCWSEEMCRGKTTGIPIYKTIEDARNAIRKYIDGTQRAEPRVIKTAGFEIGRGFFIEN